MRPLAITLDSFVSLVKMSRMFLFYKSVFGPRLYRIHKVNNTEGQDYVPYALESKPDGLVKLVRFCWAVTYWTSPVVLCVMYRRGVFSIEGLASLSSFALKIGIVMIIAVITRAVGRVMNPQYMEFLEALQAARKSNTQENKSRLAKFDGEFYAWPVDFKWNESSGGDGSKPAINPLRSSRSRRGVAEKIKTIPCEILSYLAAHTFGRRMLYPGTTSLIQSLMSGVLIQGRAKLIEEKDGERGKLLAADGNEIDCMFVDRRNNPNYPNGNTLVVCSEGNAAFYEVGCMVTPLEAGYSVLGWNHPGFGGSTGVPFPSQEENAVDVVMQYAIHRLGFPVHEIVLFAWSIGGYPACVAAMNYPDVKHCIIDASFDDVIPLAVNRMPQSWKPLVIRTIKRYMYLNNGEALSRYPGPVLLIRRTKDEMITTTNPNDISSNRGNDLLIVLLKSRYPKIIDEDTLPQLRRWLSVDKTGQERIWNELDINADLCTSILLSYVTRHDDQHFPIQLGEDLSINEKKQLAIFLASRHMEDFDSTHCTPLPPHFFKIPWSML